MIAGHFGFAAAVKARERTTPLWGLMLATVWLDIVFVPLLIAHLESVEPVRAHPAYGGMLIHADLTHSLLGMLVLSAVLGLAFLPKWGARVAIVIGLVAASHWILDLVVHRPDMPILPENFGNLPRLGFGLWIHPQLSGCVELALVLAGAVLYGRAAYDVSKRAGQSARWALISASLIAIFGLLVLYMDYSA
jgi:membrane-bound metal-dependent hydrolase YbcI (DUF457 family)